ncbi:ABC transporter, permease protein [Croceitalea dokdonensis DOKDO 023]|uniref:ABC transporter, permease protein n=1 Tax=Croceitalea dokdonensis DOKDO 023 TaxID=1300341 RepID=A0A0P7AY36_9FLAO|nr:FtsX-like permease family protein [Croceitalea dokdonensis]KPM33126.1 ABC transporter, permease protein [Croceitalea dokdonensis DOKDO 023]
MGTNRLKGKTHFHWILKMAWRDGRASGKRLLLFIGSIVLGIAAVVSIQSFSENLKDNIALQSKALMGADYRIDSNQPPSTKVQAIIDSLGGANAKSIGFPSMAVFPKNGNTKLVGIRGVEPGYPFYGDLETNPEEAAQTYHKENTALVDATVMLQFNLKVGDSVKIGNTMFSIAGSLVSAPGSNGVSASIAPPIWIPYQSVQSTGLVQTGSRIRYEYYFLANAKQNLEELDKVVDPQLDVENADLDTHLSTGQRLGRNYANFGNFLNLVAFIALLLGCVGIASSVHIYIKEKLRSVAVLKCLGATRNQTFLIYLVQIAAMGFLGGVLGVLAGIGLQYVFPSLLQDYLPFELEIGFVPQAVIVGLVLGVLMSVLFALSPLMGTWFVSPLQVLRVQEDNRAQSLETKFLVLGAIVLFVFGFAFWLLGRWDFALYFVLGILFVFLVLGGVAAGFMRLVKRFFPTQWGFAARQSILNLFRPNNQTLVLVLAIGVGTFLISTLYFTKDVLLSRTAVEATAKTPNLVLMDVQTNEKEAAAARIKASGMEVLNNIPIITMRMHQIKDRPVRELILDTTRTVNRWILQHEFRVTYRDYLANSETTVAGTWPADNQADVIPISLSENVAKDAKVEVGDRLVFNVQGVLMETVVAHIRTVDWAQMQINFSIIFPSGILENAPQFHVLTTNAANPEASADLQRKLVKQFPTVSIIDLRQVLQVVEGILGKISWVINFMAFFSILTGIIVLIGSVRNSKYQRIKESVLLRTLGAKGNQILRISALEYLFLGLLGTVLGVLLALCCSFLLARFVFDSVFVPSWQPFVIVLPLITLLVVVIGLWNSKTVISSPPLAVLRKETT